MVHSGAELLLDPTILLRLLGGLWVSVRIALLSLAIGIPLGVVMGGLRLLPSRLLRTVLRLYLEFFRIVPTLVLLFLFYYILPRELGVQVGGEVVAVVAFALWVAAEIGDVVRGGLQSVPDAQVDAARALGLGRMQLLRWVRIPQAIPLMVPATINLATRVIKTTSLLLMISVLDVVTVGQQIMEANRDNAPDAPFWIYLFIFALFFAVCWPLARLARRLERRTEERDR